MHARVATFEGAEPEQVRRMAAEISTQAAQLAIWDGKPARGEAGADSDIDLVAELDPNARVGLIRLVGLEQRVAEILGRNVDLLPEPIEQPRLRANVERDRRSAF